MQLRPLSSHMLLAWYPLRRSVLRLSNSAVQFPKVSWHPLNNIIHRNCTQHVPATLLENNLAYSINLSQCSLLGIAFSSTSLSITTVGLGRAGLFLLAGGKACCSDPAICAQGARTQVYPIWITKDIGEEPQLMHIRWRRRRPRLSLVCRPLSVGSTMLPEMVINSLVHHYIKVSAYESNILEEEG